MAVRNSYSFNSDAEYEAFLTDCSNNGNTGTDNLSGLMLSQCGKEIFEFHLANVVDIVNGIESSVLEKMFEFKNIAQEDFKELCKVVQMSIAATVLYVSDVQQLPVFGHFILEKDEHVLHLFPIYTTNVMFFENMQRIDTEVKAIYFDSTNGKPIFGFITFVVQEACEAADSASYRNIWDVMNFLRRNTYIDRLPIIPYVGNSRW